VARHDLRTGAVVLAALLVATACQASPTATPTARPTVQPTSAPTPTATPPPPVARIGPGEGALDLIVRPGYAESGTNDGAYDWVTPFEEDTGCKVNAVEAGTSEQLLAKVEQDAPGTWDGVAASGDVSLRLIADGRVQPVDMEGLFPAWNDIWPPLQSPAYNTVDGLHYGISHGWGANLLMWNSSVVRPDPTSWQAMYDPDAPYGGRLTAYDSAISIADAALYLAEARPDLDIRDPYELSRTQFDAVVGLLTSQRPLVGVYWGTPLDEISAFQDGSAVMGPSWPNQLRLLQQGDPSVPVKAVLPVEGATAWADSWMLLGGARHPNCMLRWMAWMVSPQVQKMVAEYVGHAPANVVACPLLDEHPGPFGFEGFCAFHRADDERYATLIRFWKTPLARCGDERGDSCVDYPLWLQQWDDIKAAG